MSTFSRDAMRILCLSLAGRWWRAECETGQLFTFINNIYPGNPIQPNTCLPHDCKDYVMICISILYKTSLVTITSTFSLISTKWDTFQLWNLPQVMRKMWAFLWYQNLPKFEKIGLVPLSSISDKIQTWHKMHQSSYSILLLQECLFLFYSTIHNIIQHISQNRRIHQKRNF